MPGVARADVDRRLGEPYISSISVVAAGEIDLHPGDLPSFGRGPRRSPRPTVDVHFYEYRPAGHMFEHARIVFRDGRVWYAMLPPPQDERTRNAVVARYGNVFEEETVERRSGHVRRTEFILWARKTGLAFVERPGEGITHRVVFPPEGSAR